MAQATGLSHLYPALPIMNFLAMVSMLLLIPSFWKTRIIALVAAVSWLFLGNFLHFVGMIYWRGHANDAPVFASILSILWRAWLCGFWTSTACFGHFVRQRLQPLPVRQLYDTRRRNNLIHVFFTLILPLLWAPLYLVSCPYRYRILEDFGPLVRVRQDLPGFVIASSPAFLSCVTVAIFNVRALVRYWRMKPEDIDSDITKYQSSVRTRKLLLMAAINVPLAVYGVCVQIINMLGYEWTTPTSLAKNIASLQVVLLSARSDLDTTLSFSTAGVTRTAIFMPLLSFYVFAWFGFGAEARKAYGEALLKLGRLIGDIFRARWLPVCLLPFSWSATAPRKNNSQQSLADALPLGSPKAPQITPYPSNLLPDDRSEPPATHITPPPSYSIANRIDVKREGRMPSREPARLLSIHDSPSAALNPASSIPLVSKIPLYRPSHDNLPFVPLASPNAPAIAAAGGFGSTPPSEGVANNIRRQERYASGSHARRLSCHKPAFVPLTPANANGAVPTALRPTSGNFEGHDRREKCSITSKGCCKGYRGSATLASPSTSTASRPLSSPSTAAPPY